MMKSLVFGLLLLPVLNCTSSSIVATENDWNSLRFSISGGFSGRGNGVVTVTPDGKVNIERANLQNKPVPECRGRLTNEELARLNRAISAARTGSWTMEGPNMAAA